MPVRLDQLSMQQPSQPMRLDDALVGSQPKRLDELLSAPAAGPSITVQSASGPVPLSGDDALRYLNGVQATPVSPGNYTDEGVLRTTARTLAHMTGGAIGLVGHEVAEKVGDFTGPGATQSFDKFAKDYRDFGNGVQPGVVNTGVGLAGGIAEASAGPVGWTLAGLNAAGDSLFDKLDVNNPDNFNPDPDAAKELAKGLGHGATEFLMQALLAKGMTAPAAKTIVDRIAPFLGPTAAKTVARTAVGGGTMAGNVVVHNLIEGRGTSAKEALQAAAQGGLMENAGGLLHDYLHGRAGGEAAKAPAAEPQVSETPTPADTAAAAPAAEATPPVQTEAPGSQPADTLESIFRDFEAGKRAEAAKPAVESQPAPQQGGERVYDSQDMLDYIKVKSSDVDEAGARQLLADKQYVLRDVPVGQVQTRGSTELKQGQIEQYAKQPGDKAPPVVVDANGQIIDGNRRVEAAKLRGDATLKAYVPADSTLAGPKVGDVGAGSAGVNEPVFEHGKNESPTSVKNAVVDQERAARGLPPAMAAGKRTFGTNWDDAMKTIDADPQAPDRLIKELKDKPRAVTDKESAMLLHRQIDLQNEYAGEAVAMERAQKAGDQAAIAERRARLADVSDRLQELYDVGKKAGTETGRGLAARKMLANEDYSLAAMETRKRAANDGKPLTPEQQAEVKALHDKIEELQKKLDEHETKKNEAATKQDEQDAEEASKQDFEQRKKNNKPRLFRRRPAKPVDAAQEKADLLAKIKDETANGTPPRDLRSFIQKLAENFVRSGVKDRDALIDAVHGELVKLIPTLSRRNTMDLISGYGDFKPLNPDKIKAELRDLKGQMQQVGKLEDMAGGKAPAKTGVERRVPSDTERGLIKQVNEAKRKGGFNVTDPAKQLKTALEALKTRLKNQITDLETQINSRQKLVSTHTPVARDAEAKALETRRDELKKQFDEIFGEKPKTGEEVESKRLQKQIDELNDRINKGDLSARTRGARHTVDTEKVAKLKAERDALNQKLADMRKDAQPQKSPEEIALARWKAYAENRISELLTKAEREDFTARPKKPALKLDAQGESLKAELEQARQTYQRGLMRDRMRNRTRLEKVADAFVGLRRASLLTSPISGVKLGMAAFMRLTSSPVEEAVGGVIGKLIPGIASRAPIEGGFNVRAEARAFREGVVTGMKDAWDYLKKGEGNLDSLYGKNKGLPRSAIDFIGTLHGAIKAPVKRAAFARAVEKGAAWAMRQGLDPHDPVVQQRIMLDAYKYANRAIFMQDNRVVSAFKRALQALEEKDKATGKPSVAGKLGATFLKTELPIVKVPTNIVAEIMQYTVGSLSGGAKAATALARGVDKLTPEEADVIMRHLKKGSIGAAVLALGYFGADNIGGYYQPGQKRDERDAKPGTIKIGDTTLPKFLLHTPLLEPLQIGATARRVADSKFRKHDKETQGLGAGTLAAALGVAEEVPFVRETAESAKAFDPNERTSFIGEQAHSYAVPAVVDWAAQTFDTDANGNPVQRRPETVGQHVAMGIPGLRQTVPTAAEHKAEKSRRARVR